MINETELFKFRLNNTYYDIYYHETKPENEQLLNKCLEMLYNRLKNGNYKPLTENETELLNDVYLIINNERENENE